MVYEEVIVGYGLLSAVLAIIGISFKEDEIGEDELKRRGYMVVIFSPAWLRLLFLSGAFIMLLLLVSSMTEIAQELGMATLVTLSQAGYNTLLFIFVVFMSFTGVGMLINTMDLVRKISDEKRN